MTAFAPIHDAPQDGATSASPPVSATSAGVGIAGMAGLLGWYALARWLGMDGPYTAYASVFACGIPMLLWSLLVDKVHRSPTTGIDWSRRAAFADTSSVSAFKLLGLWGTWAIIAFIYWIFRFYWQGNFATAMTIFMWVIGPLVLLSIPYVYWLDRYLVEPRDGAYYFGRWLAGDGDGAAAPAIFAHLRSWAVKGFFTAFMVSIIPGNYPDLVNTPTATLLSDPVALTQYAIIFLFMIDVHFATVGYVLTMRPLDAHIREANPYGMAWVAALMCYPPFVLMNPGGVLSYDSIGVSLWSQHLAGQPVLLAIWGTALVLLTAIYAWATVVFGLRFSNLTHRGIITHGPYRWTRHPAYVSKNLFWWLSALPFLSATTTDAVRNTVLLALVSGVYYWRAKTEEQQLLADPDYQAYWRWAQAHAIIPRLFKRYNGQDAPLVTLQPTRDRIG